MPPGAVEKAGLFADLTEQEMNRRRVRVLRQDFATEQIGLRQVSASKTVVRERPEVVPVLGMVANQ